MGFLGTDELEAIRNHMEATLPDTCSIISVTNSADGQGGVTETPGTVTGVPCRCSPVPIQARSDSTGEQFRVHNVYVFSLHWDRAVTVRDKIVFDSDTYRVIGLNDDHSERFLRRATTLKEE